MTPDSLFSIKQTLCAFDEKRQHLSDQQLDDLLGINILDTEKKIDLWQLLEDYPGQRVYAGDITYPIIRKALKLIPNGEDICDLGSGYGRLVFYSALLRQRRVFGIEIVHERVIDTLRVQRELGIGNLTIQQGDVLLCEIPEVRYFINMNSLMPDVLAQFLLRMKAVAARKKIYLISVSTANLIMEKQDWLSEVMQDKCRGRMAPRLFSSRTNPSVT